MARPQGCVICSNPDGRPENVVAELSATWVTAPSEAALPGYVCVVAKTHVAEPFELNPAEQVAFWSDCMLVSRALTQLLKPRKMNYEIHGNTIPHLHMHLYPRYDGDPYEGRPIDGRSTRFTRSEEEIHRIEVAVKSTTAT